MLNSVKLRSVFTNFHKTDQSLIYKEFGRLIDNDKNY